MTLPNFLVIGAPKTGTSSLYHYLNQHPQIYMSSNKEPHFFAFEGKRPDFCGPGDEGAWINRGSVPELPAYEALFDGVSDEKAIGEASTMYLYLPQAAPRIRQYIPDAKLIAILRHPVDRAYSHFLHLRREAREPLRDFSKALREEQQRIDKHWSPVWHYQNVGFYGEQLQRYFDQFEREQIRVYLYEEWQKNPQAIVSEIFQFLGVDPIFSPDMSVKHNVSSFVHKNKAWHDFLTGSNPLKTVLKAIIPANIRKPISAKAYRKNMEPPSQLHKEIRQEAIEIFRSDLLKLQDIIEKDISHWLK